MSLTERKIKYLEPGKSRQIVWDNGGFGVQVTPEGEKSFVLEYRFNEMTKLITLGIYPDMSLDMARLQALKAMEMVMKGKDPENGLPAPEKPKLMFLQVKRRLSIKLGRKLRRRWINLKGRPPNSWKRSRPWRRWASSKKRQLQNWMKLSKGLRKK